MDDPGDRPGVDQGIGEIGHGAIQLEDQRKGENGGTQEIGEETACLTRNSRRPPIGARTSWAHDAPDSPVKELNRVLERRSPLRSRGFCSTRERIGPGCSGAALGLAVLRASRPNLRVASPGRRKVSVSKVRVTLVASRGGSVGK